MRGAGAVWVLAACAGCGGDARGASGGQGAGGGPAQDAGADATGAGGTASGAAGGTAGGGATAGAAGAPSPSCWSPGLRCTVRTSSEPLRCECLGTHQWSCEGPTPPGLPELTPDPGTACATRDVTCETIACLPVCECAASDRWQCTQDDCAPPICPTSAPHDTPCDESLLGQACQYSGFCAPTCTCARPARGAAPRWYCLSPPC